MKYLVAFWAVPLVTFWSWYFLSLNDINFGTVYLSRDLHDLIIELFGILMALDPAAVPGVIAEGCVFDALILLAIWAFRRRRELAVWIGERYERHFAAPATAILVEVQADEPSA